MFGFDHFGFLAPFYDRVISFQNADRLIKAAKLPIQGVIIDAGGASGGC